jgi:hypothetical protein
MRILSQAYAVLHWLLLVLWLYRFAALGFLLLGLLGPLARPKAGLDWSAFALSIGYCAAAFVGASCIAAGLGFYVLNRNTVQRDFEHWARIANASSYSEIRQINRQAFQSIAGRLYPG